MWLILCLMSVYIYPADITIDLEEHKLSSSRQELAVVIIDSFFKKKDHICNTKLAPRVEQLLQSESEEFCALLALHAESTQDLSPVVADHVSEKVLTLFTRAVEITLEKETEEKQSRCKKSSVIILTALISLASAAGAAAITAAITSALS